MAELPNYYDLVPWLDSPSPREPRTSLDCIGEVSRLTLQANRLLAAAIGSPRVAKALYKECSTLMLEVARFFELAAQLAGQELSERTAEDRRPRGGNQ